jgi:hypothetical protein
MKNHDKMVLLMRSATALPEPISCRDGIFPWQFFVRFRNFM